MSAAGRAVPVVGVSTYNIEASYGSWKEQAAIVPWSYLDKVLAAGGAPLLVPPGSPVVAVISRLDALLLTGGPDVEPSRYGAAADPRTEVPNHARDEAEIALFHAAVAGGLAVLAICRGLQLVNVACGGTLVQHLPDRAGHEGHRPVPGSYGATKVTIEGESLLGAVLGGDGQEASAPIEAACHHHQAVETVGRGLRAVAFAEDGTIEALEATGERAGPADALVLAVQWHPEEQEDPRLFCWLIEQARRPRS